MDIFETNTNSYCDSIKVSNYEQRSQSINSPLLFHSIFELLVYNFIHEYKIITGTDKQVFLSKKKMEIATNIDEKSSDVYDKFSYNKFMKKNIIQKGLQEKNCVSTLLYLNDLFNVNCYLYDINKKVYVKTSLKEKDRVKVGYNNKKFFLLDDEDVTSFSETDFSTLDTYFTMDVTTNDIYSKHLKSIGNYKVTELSELANSLTISLMKDGKKKVKKELYDDINMYYLNK